MAYNFTNGDGERIFSPMYADVWETNLKHMSGADVKVYIALLMHTTQKDRVWFMSIDELAEDAGVSRSTAAAAKDRLVKVGLVEQSWRYKDDNGDYHLTDTRPPPRMQGKNVYKVNVKPKQPVESENETQSPRVRKSEPIESENRNLVESENRNQTIAPPPEHPTEQSPLPPTGVESALFEEPLSFDDEHHPADPFDDQFNEFWKVYPHFNKVTKAMAKKSLGRALKKADFGTIMAGARNYALQCERERTEKKFVAHATTWLNQERWELSQDSLVNGSSPQNDDGLGLLRSMMNQ